MESRYFTIYLGVNYHTAYGENVYVVGNIRQLGDWQVEKGLQLKYHEGGNWASALKLKKKDKIVEYKYVVYNPIQNYSKWEEGPNRIFDLSCLKESRRDVYNIEVWNHREVSLRIKYDCGPKETLAICGDNNLLGNWRHPVKMMQVMKKDPLLGHKTTYWEKTFCIKPDTKRIKYRYVLIHEDEDRATWEREPDRVCDFTNLEIPTDEKKDESFPNQKDSIKFVKKHNKYIKYDCNFVAKLFFNSVTESIIIGPYPQNQSEIEYLAKEGVKAVFNLQTRHDMKYRSIDWELLTQHYYMAGIKAVNFAIVDMCAEDLFLKAFDGAVLLNGLVEKYQTVYVHCTAGIGRAPHVVAVYLMFFKGYSVDDVIKFIKEKRPVAYLNREVLWKIYTQYAKKVQGLNVLSTILEKDELENNLRELKENVTPNVVVAGEVSNAPDLAKVDDGSTC